MSNSSLVSCTVLSPNHSGKRNHAVDRITPHCVVGQCTAQRIGEIFLPKSRQASSNYGIGVNGEVGLYVDEDNRSWCSSSSANDQRAITIECASDTTAPYVMNSKVYSTLIDLCEDICRRYRKDTLIWIPDKTKALAYKPKANEMLFTVHRWFANKSCPGDWLYSRLGEVAAEVTQRLKGTPVEEKPVEEKPASKILYRVQTGAYKNKKNADACLAKVKAAGFDTYMVQVGGLYKVQVGAFEKKANAEAMAKKLQNAGFDTYITTQSGSAASVTPETPAIKVGDIVRINKGAKVYGSSKTFSTWVYETNLFVREISKNRVAVSTVKTGPITGPVRMQDLTKIQ